ncbi:MAG TPA: methyltransferase domain-containing protein [Candidatus Saccharimonadales bacterium]|nr:methyltransferase domain-containing protein [Candidatus Saccharimonadales bacterium]
MPRKKEYSVELGVSNYSYPSDGWIRRQMHEWGASGFDFYGEALKRLGISYGDIVLDVGAGMGYDGLSMATTYRPRAVYLLEPHADEDEEGQGIVTDFDVKYYHLGIALWQKGLTDVRLLPSADFKRFSAEIGPPAAGIQAPGITYIQPVEAVAEDIPLPDNSVSKLTMIHSAYHFSDIRQAFSEAGRVMAPGAIGMLITNGPDDKRNFKNSLQKAGEALRNPASTTVSSRLYYPQAVEMLSQDFDIVDEPLVYQDTMLIDEERLPDYIWAYNSYRHFFERPIVNDGRWDAIREEVFEGPIRRAMAGNDGTATDSIDIAAIYFRAK